MYGAIIGDLAGSIYEYEQLKKIKTIYLKNIIEDNSFFSDDTILTVAILDAILNDCNYEFYLKKYCREFIDYKPDFKPYFKTSFSKKFINFVNLDEKSNSTGNGALMRISPIGYLFNTEDTVIKNAIKATIPSHNTEEAIYSAKIVALIIFYSRNNMGKDWIIKKLNLNIEYKPFEKFNTTCYETLNNCLYALFNSNSYEDSIKNIISYGGDTDTNACIVGSMAEAMYGLSNLLIKQAQNKIPKEFVKKLNSGYKLTTKI